MILLSVHKYLVHNVVNFSISILSPELNIRNITERKVCINVRARRVPQDLALSTSTRNAVRCHSFFENNFGQRFP